MRERDIDLGLGDIAAARAWQAARYQIHGGNLSEWSFLDRIVGSVLMLADAEKPKKKPKGGKK